MTPWYCAFYTEKQGENSPTVSGFWGFLFVLFCLNIRFCPWARVWCGWVGEASTAVPCPCADSSAGRLGHLWDALRGPGLAVRSRCLSARRSTALRAQLPPSLYCSAPTHDGTAHTGQDKTMLDTRLRASTHETGSGPGSGISNASTREKWRCDLSLFMQWLFFLGGTAYQKNKRDFHFATFVLYFILQVLHEVPSHSQSNTSDRWPIYDFFNDVTALISGKHQENAFMTSGLYIISDIMLFV